MIIHKIQIIPMYPNKEYRFETRLENPYKAGGKAEIHITKVNKSLSFLDLISFEK